MDNLLIGKSAPDFEARAVIGNQIVENFSLKDLMGRYVVFFFYPLDFTFVCPTEIHAFQEESEAFTTRNAQVVACSVDSPFAHLAWLNTPRHKGGIEGVSYPLVSDLNKSISRSFHVLKEDEGIAYRGLFIIDREGIIRQQLVNDLSIGRSVDEALRFLDALITHEEEGEVCPANWKRGAKTMQPTSNGLEGYFNQVVK
jgi:peroxiredoxin 2/4